MEISRKKQREKVLHRFKYIQTCVLARELCLLVRTNRALLSEQDVHNCCSFIAGLCKEWGCTEPSEMCKKAAEAVLHSEEEYLELCKKSCQKCGESRMPKQEKKKTMYVA